MALKIIVPKIRSQEEKVALLGLAVSQVINLLVINLERYIFFPFIFQVLEACVKNCGQRFHQELGKFKFLNELIRLLSPKVCEYPVAHTWIGDHIIARVHMYTTCVRMSYTIPHLIFSILATPPLQP